MVSTGKLCKAKTKKGEPCAGFAVGDGDYCFVHDPARAAERAAARRKGGQARHGRTLGTGQAAPETVSLRTVGELLTLLEEEAAELLRLERSVSRTRALVSLVSAAGGLIVDHELEQRITALEGKLNE